MPFGYGLWSWFAKNPIAQGIAIFLIAIMSWKINNLVVANNATRRQRARHREASLKKDIAIREQSDEAVEAADSVRSNTRRVRATRVRNEPLPG